MKEEHDERGAILPLMAIVLILLIGGLFYFKRMEDRFADVI